MVGSRGPGPAECLAMVTLICHNASVLFCVSLRLRNLCECLLERARVTLSDWG